MKCKTIGFILFFILHISAWAIYYPEETYPFYNDHDRELFHYLTKELRCLVCQNQTLAESHAPLAKDLRHVIYRQIQNGDSKEKIIKMLTHRYGSFILYSPPLQTNTYFLWFFPLILVITTSTILAIIFYRNKKQASIIVANLKAK